jgi:hypothetical protein
VKIGDWLGLATAGGRLVRVVRGGRERTFGRVLMPVVPLRPAEE